jgi:hypothetical protein
VYVIPSWEERIDEMKMVSKVQRFRLNKAWVFGAFPLDYYTQDWMRRNAMFHGWDEVVEVGCIE